MGAAPSQLPAPCWFNLKWFDNTECGSFWPRDLTLKRSWSLSSSAPWHCLMCAWVPGLIVREISIHHNSESPLALPLWGSNKKSHKIHMWQHTLEVYVTYGRCPVSYLDSHRCPPQMWWMDWLLVQLTHFNAEFISMSVARGGPLIYANANVTFNLIVSNWGLIIIIVSINFFF